MTKRKTLQERWDEGDSSVATRLLQQKIKSGEIIARRTKQDLEQYEHAGMLYRCKNGMWAKISVCIEVGESPDHLALVRHCEVGDECNDDGRKDCKDCEEKFNRNIDAVASHIESTFIGCAPFILNASSWPEVQYPIGAFVNITPTERHDPSYAGARVAAEILSFEEVCNCEDDDDGTCMCPDCDDCDNCPECCETRYTIKFHGFTLFRTKDEIDELNSPLEQLAAAAE